MTTTHDTIIETLRELDADFQRATGHQAYLYATQPASATYYVFTDGSRIGASNAVRYMKGLLGQAQDDPEGDWRWW